MYHGKGCVENVTENIEDKVKQLYTTFSESSMIELTYVLEEK